MSSPKIICKSGYIKSAVHFLNTLEYAGNKISSQRIVFKDGGQLDIDSNEKIVLSDAEAAEVAGINITYKDGGGKLISYDSYRKITKQTGQAITVSELVTTSDDSAFLKNTAPRELQDLDFFKYLSYIEDRKGAEKSEDGHGLFGITGDISIEEAKATAIQCENSRKWTHILSLADDGASVGFNKRELWQALIADKAPEIAKLYNISLENLIINAAFHSNTDNAHIHLMFYSTDSAEGFIRGGEEAMNNASNRLKSTFLNTIYKDDLLPLHTQHNTQRSELKQKIDSALHMIYSKDYTHTKLEELLLDLSSDMEQLEGKVIYGFLPKPCKDKVNGILKWVIENDSDVSSLFRAYCDTQKEYIAGYEADPQKIERDLQTFQEEFYAPKSGRGLYQNLIVKIAKDLSAAALSHSLRAAEKEITDFKPDNPLLSSDYYEIPLPDDFDIPPLIDDDVPLPMDFDIPLHIDDEIPLLDDFDVPPPIDDAPPPDDFDVPADFDCPPLLEPLRAAEEEIADFKPDDPSLSSSKSERYREMEQYLKTKKNCINFGSFSKAYCKALGDIFNSKVKNTSLQDFALERLQELEKTAKDKKHHKDTIKQVHEIFHLIKSTDGDFNDHFNSILENSKTELLKKFTKMETEQYLNRFRQTAESSGKVNLAHSYIYYFAENLDDQKYYQLLDAYQELNKPLNKVLCGSLSSLDDDLVLVLKDIADCAPYLDDKEVAKQIRPLIKNALELLQKDPIVSEALDTYIHEYGIVLSENFEPEKAKIYTKRFQSTLFDVSRLMRPHYAIINFAKSLDEQRYRKVIQENKFAFEDISKLISVWLKENLLDENLSSRLSNLHTELLSEEHSPAKSAQITKTIFDLFKQDMQIDRHLTAATNTLDTAIDKSFNDPNTALAFKSRLRTDLEHGSPDIPFHFSVQSFAKNLKDNQAKYCFGKLKAELKEFRSSLFGAMRIAYADEKSPNHQAVKTMLEAVKDVRDLDLDRLLSTLSTVSFPLLEQKQKLCCDFAVQMRLQIDTSDEDAKKVFDKFFYEQDNKYNTLSIRKIVHSFIISRDKIKLDYQVYRQALLKRQLIGLVHGIGRILHMQAQHRQQQNAKEQEKKHSLAGKKQFKNQRQFAPPSTLQTNELSY